jgi:tRNA A-37 threonylcarbamoyl transferase component Bud32
MALVSSARLLHTLDPPDHAVLKREEGTIVWREADGDGRALVVKLYRRRGAWNALRGRVTCFRTEREHQRLRHLERWGVPCTPPLAWAAGRSPEHGYHEVLVMGEVPHVVDLGAFVRQAEGDIDLAPLFRIVRRMHEAGFCHQTLYPGNILVKRGAPPEEAYVMCDVPRSWVFPRSIVGTSMARYDLLDLATRLIGMGVPADRIALAAYGPMPGGPDLTLLLAGPDPTTKLRRLIRDGSARIRWALAWGTTFRARHGP